MPFAKRFAQAILVLAFVTGVFGSQRLAHAQAEPCDLALVLAIDASSSVDAVEYALQMRGTAAALLDPKVVEAILALNGVYIAVFEWNGRSNQKQVADWHLLETEADIVRLSSAIAAHERGFDNFPTAIGHAMAYASTLFPALPAPCFREVIDVSGDGVNNEGYDPQIAYRVFPFENRVVNGLVILGDKPNPEPYYRDIVLYGPGAFLIIANGFDDFARAMREKLLREIQPGPIAFLEQ